MTHPVMLGQMGRQLQADARKRGPRRGRKEDLIGALRNTALFAFATDRDLRNVTKHAHTVDVDKGTTIVREGEPGDRFYVVLEGLVRVTRNGRKVCDLGVGKSFGELALLANMPRNATVTAVEDTEVVSFDRKTFAKVLDESPLFARRLLEGVAKRLRECDAKAVQ
ncbi:MAG: cyclic nucleotide-binding protein [Actinomycetia bacterium]|nr:cyclic nucleotide-binding protein [Actinomycetes bacterium]